MEADLSGRPAGFTLPFVISTSYVMNVQAKPLIALVLGAVLFMNVSCDGGGAEFGGMKLAPMDTTGSLQSAAEFPVGVGISADSMLSSSAYASTVRNQFDQVTMEYAMKQAPIVQSDGSFDYSYADEVIQFSQDSDLDVYGHTLIWHSNNTGDYLRSLVSGGSGDDFGPNVLPNGGFENGSGDSFDSWVVYNDEDATFSVATDEVHSGERALKIENTAPHPDEPWRVQIVNEGVPMEVGAEYEVSFWIKAEQEGGSGRLSTDQNQYQGDFNTSTSWIPITWTITAQASATNIALDMGYVANTYYVDDVRVRKVGGGEEGPPNVLDNGDFEAWEGAAPDGWTVLNNSNGSFSKATSSSNVHGGSNALQATVDETAENYNLQIQSPEFSTTEGDTYEVRFWIKGSTDGVQHQVEWRHTGTEYTGDQDTPTSYAPMTYSFTANSGSASIAFDLGASPPSETYIDDVTVTNSSEGTGEDDDTAVQDSMAVAGFMQDYITSTVSHYADYDLVGWDVVNEPLQDGTGSLRTDNSPGTPTEGGTFYWAKYLGAPAISNREAIGESYIANAFRYAEEADPDVPLFINDYNLESDATKRDSMVALVNALLENDVPIDGIGTQMHIDLNTSHAGIDQMFRDLASTGLMVKVTELDVRINPDDVSSFEPTPTMLSYQQVMYHYVVWSYLQNVPEKQRAGITVWNLTDSDSWLVQNQGYNDYPTLFNDAYEKKPAFSGFLRGLKGMAPNADE